MRVIYYYQSFVGLQQLINTPQYTTHLNLGAIHFGSDDNNNSYIHLNNDSPYDDMYNDLWKEIKQVQDLNIKVNLMIGGAGGGFEYFFNNYEVCYELLTNLIINSNINGVDLDIEEYVDINNVIKLINQLRLDFDDDFIITMAPISSSLQYDQPGLGGFVYKQLYDIVGDKINWFNVQEYNDYTYESYELMINNYYPANKLVFGMLSSEYNVNLFNDALNEIKKIYDKWNDFGGCFTFEYFNAPPNVNNPIVWSQKIYNTINDLWICKLFNSFYESLFGKL